MISFFDFFVAINGDAGRKPHPWQEALAARLAAGEPPRAIVVPTGGGKTVTIDALVWALAVQADRPPHERTIGVRTVWAIDRRILVDEVHERACQIAARLADALAEPTDVLYELASRLRSLTGTGPPLLVTRWRGGLARETRAHHPFQPQIITSTVAQIGSRLLFRGYGVGERSLALEAGLAAVDTTVCLDEAHLAEPFRQTVDAICRIRASEPAGLPALRAITLTATPLAGLADADTLGIGAADRVALGTRLTGPKIARLVEPAADRAADQVAALLDAVEEHLDAGASTVACIVNAVRTAIEVNAGLARRRPDVDQALLIGPQRPVDRDQVLERYREQLFDRVSGDRPFVCIATQTFEVGLDADVDALVTQSASASALVQRLGRLNRAGLGSGRATVVRDTSSSPLYAEDEPRAWTWLSSLPQPDGEIDVSVASLMDDETRPSPTRSRNAPGLTPHTLELLVQTAPRPARMADPDVEVFLRGAEEQASTDVGLCWRCDLRIDDDSPEARSYRAALLRLVPPGREEVVTVSIARAHALLKAMRAAQPQLAALGKASLDTPDIEGGDEGGLSLEQRSSERIRPDAPGRLVLLRGREQFEVTLDGLGDPQQDAQLRDVRPGDLLVLPTSAGGYAHGAIAPMSRELVDDVAPDMRARREGQACDIVRLSQETLGREWYPIVNRAAACERAPSAAALDELCGMLGPLGDRLRGRDELVLRRLTVDAAEHLGDLDLDEFDDIEVGADAQIFEEDSPTASAAFVLLARDVTTPEELRPARTPPPSIDAHARAVAQRVKDFTAGSGLPQPVAGALELAARAHDHGKADPRFQTFFRGGVPALLGTPIAKSVFGTADLQASRAARSAAGLPRGLRHEIGSVAALADAIARGAVADMPEHVDIELAYHLVATHHGLGRPVPRVPSPSAAGPREFVVDAAGIVGSARGDAIEGWDGGAWLRRFLAVIERYGPWGTAYLEALLILADRTVSGEGH
jgi:CRISPR-associated endonuclease/helicase Cas3